MNNLSLDIIENELLIFLDIKSKVNLSQLNKEWKEIIDENIKGTYSTTKIIDLEYVSKNYCKQCNTFDLISIIFEGFCENCYRNNICSCCLNPCKIVSKKYFFEKWTDYTGMIEYCGEQEIGQNCKFKCKYCEIEKNPKDFNNTSYIFNIGWYRKEKKIKDKYKKLIDNKYMYNFCCYECFQMLEQNDKKGFESCFKEIHKYE